MSETDKWTTLPSMNTPREWFGATAIKDKIFVVQFSEPIRGVASGQSAVFYDKNICLGGGIISKSA